MVPYLTHTNYPMFYLDQQLHTRVQWHEDRVNQSNNYDSLKSEFKVTNLI